MEENRPSRGRARGRSRQHPDVLQGLAAAPEPEAAGADNVERPMEQFEEVYDPAGSPGSGSPSSHGSNGNGSSSNGNGNGNGSGSGSGNGHHSDEDVPGVVRGRVSVRGDESEKPDFYLTTRPSEDFDKRGTSGFQRKFLTNYFLLQKKNNFSMRLHVVTFDGPDILGSIPKRKALLRTREDQIGPFIFDGAQFFTTKELPAEALQEFVVSFPDKPEESWRVRIRFLRVCSWKEPLVTQLYNLIVRRAQQLLNLDFLGRFFFDGERVIELRNQRLQIWPGYITSMRQMENDVLLNVDTTFKVCRTEDVFTLMKQIRQKDPQQYRPACERAIVGTVVMTRYNRKTYKIDAINWDLKPTNTFPVKRKRVTTETSFYDYYKSKDCVIRNINQPMLVSYPTKRDIRRGDTGDKLLVPEMCFQTGLNDEMRGNFHLMKELQTYLHASPQERLKQTKQFMQKIVTEGSTEMHCWGMRIRPEPEQVNGRVLPPEELLFANNPQTGQPSVFKSSEQADWTMAFRKEKMLLSKNLDKWVLIFPSRNGPDMDNLVQMMIRVATPLGYRINRPEMIPQGDISGRGLENVIDRVVAQHQGRLDMIMVVLASNNLDTYAAVKKKCSAKYGIPSQCFLSSNVTKKGLMSICTKLVIQMNAKQGGQPWSVKNPLPDIMVVGYDVHHGKGMKSYGAMTATMTGNLASYYSTILEQGPGEELSSGIGRAFGRCLESWRKCNNGKLPLRIMFYRDGVGEGQLHMVYNTEVVSLRAMMELVYHNVPKPKFTMVVVTKRINTRLFEVRGNDAINPSPGTVVDDVITCPEKYDFFLVPQNARQGTVSPVSFNVLCDESGLDADKIQRFTFKLCHLYYNWSGTVAVPAPCQYAHKLAFLTGTALQSEVNDRLSNYLHFL